MWPVATWLPRVVELALVLGIGTLALAVRLPNHQLIPSFTDELKDLYRAFLLLHGWVVNVQHTGELRDVERGVLFVGGRAVSLTGTSTYFGSLWEWLLAAALWASGSSIYAPRALILALGVLTVLASYPLGRAWGGPLGGALAAGLLATAGGHVVVNSHVAWSACLAPLFSTLGVWTLDRAVCRGRARGAGGWLLASGLCWGLAVQTHPAVLALLPGAGAYLLWRGRWLLGTCWAYLGAGLFVLANLNLLVYNLSTGFGSVAQGLERNETYTQQQQLTPEVYLQRLARLLTWLVWLLGGAVSDRSLGDAGLWPIVLAAVGGVLWQWRQGNPLPGLLVASTVVVLPLFNGRFEHVLHWRYLAPLVPILYAAVGATAAQVLDRLRQAPGGSASHWRPVLLQCGSAAVAALLVFLVLHPLLYLRAYYERPGRTNEPILRTVEQIRANRGAGETVVIDELLGHEEYKAPNGWRLSTVLQVLLRVNDLPYRIADPASGELLDPRNRCRDQLVILASRDRKAAENIVAELKLRDLQHAPARVQARAGQYGVYRLEQLPGASSLC